VYYLDLNTTTASAAAAGMLRVWVAGKITCDPLLYTGHIWAL